MSLRVVFGILVSLLLYISSSDAAHLSSKKEKVLKKKDFAFLTRFAFNDFGDTASGKVGIDIISKYNTQKLVMYVGQESWESVYKNDNKTCKEKEDGAQLSFEISNPVGNGYQFLGYFDIAVYDKPTFWFFGISSCHEEDLQVSQFSLKLTQAQGNNKEFSYDERGLLPISITFAVLYTILLGLFQFFITRIPRSTLPPILSWILLAQTLGVFCQMIHYSIYFANGRGLFGLLYSGGGLISAAQMFYFALMLIISRGVDLPIKTIDGWLFKIIILAYVIVYAASDLVEIFRDSSDLRSRFQSIPGIFLLIVRCCSFPYFLYNLRLSYKEEVDMSKLSFYKKFGVFGTIWFVMFPLVWGIGSTAPDVDLATVLSGISNSIQFVSFVVLILLYIPLWTNPSSGYSLNEDSNQELTSPKPSGNSQRLP